MMLGLAAVITHAALCLGPALDQVLHIDSQPLLVAASSQPQVKIIYVVFLAVLEVFALVVGGR